MERMTRRALLAGGFAAAAGIVPGVASAASVLAAGRGRIVDTYRAFPSAVVDPGVALSSRSVVLATPMTDQDVTLAVQLNTGADVFYVYAHGDNIPDPLPFSWVVLRR